MFRKKSLGIEGYEIFNSKDCGISLTFSGGEIKSREQSSESGYGLRVLKNGRLGFSYCERESLIESAAKRAVKLSKFSPKTKFSFPKISKYPKLKLVDKKIIDMDANELKGILNQVRDGLIKYAKKTRIILSSGSEEISLKNDNGLDGSYKTTSISAYCEGMKEDGFGFGYYDGTHMPKDFTEIGERAGRMAKEMKDAKKLKKGEYRVVFRHTSMDELLNILLPSFSGENKRKKTTVLAEKKGKQAFNKKLSIYDDPLAQAGDARPFDDEGTRSKRIPLIENGIIKNFIYDRETAALEGIKKSGFCNRAHYSAMPGAGTSNIIINPGKYNDLEAELIDPLVVHSLHGSHTANTTTGDFGLEVNVAFYKNKPVRGFLLSGNIFKLLKGKIYLGKKVKTQGSLIAPLLGFENMQVIS
jgi:PmbA protein